MKVSMDTIRMAQEILETKCDSKKAVSPAVKNYLNTLTARADTIVRKHDIKMPASRKNEGEGFDSARIKAIPKDPQYSGCFSYSGDGRVKAWVDADSTAIEAYTEAIKMVMVQLDKDAWYNAVPKSLEVDIPVKEKLDHMTSTLMNERRRKKTKKATTKLHA